VDDSLVRGNTMQYLVQKLRENGAAAIHVRISSPPLISPCYWGVDIPNRQDLIASNKNVEEVRRYINADSLKYLSVGDLDYVLGKGCRKCFIR